MDYPEIEIYGLHRGRGYLMKWREFEHSYHIYCGVTMVNVLKFRTPYLFFSNKQSGYLARMNKMLVRIDKREDPDQTASSEAVWSGSALFVYPFLVVN